jgi:hypothetical protein
VGNSEAYFEGDNKLSAIKSIPDISNRDPEIGIHQWLGIRNDDASEIDPGTAKVSWKLGLIMDPYGVKPDLPEEREVIDRVYFARAPDSNVSVSFDDRPDVGAHSTAEAPQTAPGQQ